MPGIRPVRDESGASAVEYGLLITGIAALIALIVFLFGGFVSSLFNDSCQRIADQSSSLSGCL